MVCNLGTYLDSPFHRYPDRADLSQIPLERVAGVPGIVPDLVTSSDRAITLDCDPGELCGRAVLIRTGWDRRWETDRYWEPGPYLSDASVDLLIGAKAALVGVDFWNVDNTEDPSRPAHTRLLAAEILIVEHLCNLAPLPRTGFRFSAVPLRIVRGASFPVRAFAEID
jgi:kynurenine formamidase